LKLGVRELVRQMENAVIGILEDYHVKAAGRTEAPGVYVGKAKIASLGLKIRRNFCYHGIALNVDMDLTPFSHINPCGYQGLQVTQTKDLGIPDGVEILSTKLANRLQEQLLKKTIN
jgi:lipoyl(octanoyl) transferase